MLGPPLPLIEKDHIEITLVAQFTTAKFTHCKDYKFRNMARPWSERNNGLTNSRHQFWILCFSDLPQTGIRNICQCAHRCMNLFLTKDISDAYSQYMGIFKTMQYRLGILRSATQFK